MMNSFCSHEFLAPLTCLPVIHSLTQIKVNGRVFLGFATKKKAAQDQAAQEACVVLGLAPVQVHAAELRRQEGDAPKGTMWPLKLAPVGAQQQQQQQQQQGGVGMGSTQQQQSHPAPSAAGGPQTGAQGGVGSGVTKKAPAPPSVIDQIRAAFRPENVLVKSVKKKLADG